MTRIWVDLVLDTPSPPPPPQLYLQASVYQKSPLLQHHRLNWEMVTEETVKILVIVQASGGTASCLFTT